MDEIRNFFNNPSRNKVKRVPGPKTCGRRLIAEDLVDTYNRKEEHRHTVSMTGTDYAREVKEREHETYMKNECEWTSVSGGLESLEHLSTFGMSNQNIQELTEEAMTEVYSKYSFQVKEDTNNLAINDYKQKILDCINGQPVSIIEGPTGCGKTTQVPQWILDDCYQKRKHCKIVVTQPRRIAATSIAKRVAAERGWDVGGLVGYQVGLDNKTSNDTRIHYVTTGILLQKLVSAKTLNEYTHIILDEVHERGQEMDFLLLVVKKLLYTVSMHVKVVLMSATFNYEAFASYFKIPTPRGFEKSSWIKVVKNKSMFTVKTFYLNHLQKFGDILRAVTRSEEANIPPEMYKLVIKLVNAFELIDKQEDSYVENSDAVIPSVLMFLPGIYEIEELYKCLMDIKMRTEVAGVECGKYKWYVLPLHSTITTEEQVRVFQRAPPGHRKIILSTNIAESSITVPDIKYVVDFCLMKVLVADEQTNFTSLRLQWASKTNCEQRAGRAGRVCDGRVYRLVTDKFYDTFKQECPPEICRCPLERLVLLAKMLEMGPPKDILGLAMDPPDMSNIMRTMLVLKEIGGLKKTLDGELSLDDGDITYLGRVMARLPLDVRASKLIMLGHIFGCLNETIIMAAAMSVKDVFNTPFKERLNAYNSKLTWADGSCSDCIAFYNAYRVWSHLRQQQYFKQQGNNEVSWARRFYVQVRYLRELDDLVREITMRLSREGIEPHQGKSPWARNEQPLILKVLIAGAFYPHYFVQVGASEGREREACKTLGGLDPRTTVYLKDFPLNQPGPIYAGAIKNIVKQLTHDEPTVTFDSAGSKVYLTFDDPSQSTKKGDEGGNPNIPGKVVLPVYKAVKARQLKMDIRLNLLPQDKAKELFQALELSKLSIDNDKLVPKLPEIDDTHIPITISQFINCGHFWVQYDDESTASDLRRLSSALGGRLAPAGVELAPGDVLAAPYQENGYFRVRLQKIMPKDMVWVFYIDFGTYSRLHISNLRALPKGVCQDLPPLAMECTLAEVTPSAILEQHAEWTPEATKFFHSLIQKKPLLAKVYSVYRGVVAVELLAEGGRVNVNKLLIENGFAKACEESYDSKLNHDLRDAAPELNLSQKRAFNRQQMSLAAPPLPPADTALYTKECAMQLHLKGPFSPLESTVHTLMYGSRHQQVLIEWNSVNSVLLDTEPQEVYERLLVAGLVGTNEGASRLTLRHTTLMPNIPGLPAIIALIFCPMSELRRDAERCRYVSALCGLGPSAADGCKPLFPEHDILVNIDAQLTIADIEMINYIRLQMDYMLFCPPGHDQPAQDNVQLNVPSNIRDKFMQLISVPRKHYESRAVEHAWEWGSVPEEELLELTEPAVAARAVLYPLHTPLELYPVSRDQLKALKDENDRLIDLVRRTPITSSREVQCKLCGSEFMSTQAMRIHLQSRLHREKEEDFKIFDS